RARQELHRQVKGIAIPVSLVNRHDVRVRERGRRTDLPKKSVAQLLTGALVWSYPLEGGNALREVVSSPKDLPHTAAPQGFQQDVGTDPELTPQSLLELVGLVGRQPLSLSQFPEEFLTVPRSPGDGVEFGELLTRKEVVRPQRLDQGVQGVHRTAPGQ